LLYFVFDCYILFLIVIFFFDLIIESIKSITTKHS